VLEPTKILAAKFEEEVIPLPLNMWTVMGKVPL
jgi:hypothetical protein